MSFIESLKDLILGKKKTVHMQLDPESVKQNNLIRGLANENAELKGVIARLTSEVGQYREAYSDKVEEEEVKEVLNEEKQQLEKKSKGKYFSMRSFFATYFKNKKFREKLAITSFDRSTNFGGFGDFGFSADGDFVVLDSKGQVVLKMKNLNDIFQSVGGLGNDIKAAKIPVNLDKEGAYIENIMVYEAPEVQVVGDKLRFSKARKRPVYEIIQQLNELINEKQRDLEEAEFANQEMQRRIDDMERANRLLENGGESARVDLSKAEQRQSAIERAFRQSEKDILMLKEMNVIFEENMVKLEEELRMMRDEALRQGVKLSDDKALELIERIRSTIVMEQPKIKEVVKTESMPLQLPGQQKG